MYNSTSSTTQKFYSTYTSNGTTTSSLASNYSYSLFYKTTTTFVDAAEKTAYLIWVGWTGVSTTQANLTNATAAAKPAASGTSEKDISHGL